MNFSRHNIVLECYPGANFHEVEKGGEHPTHWPTFRPKFKQALMWTMVSDFQLNSSKSFEVYIIFNYITSESSPSFLLSFSSHLSFEFSGFFCNVCLQIPKLKFDIRHLPLYLLHQEMADIVENWNWIIQSSRQIICECSHHNQRSWSKKEIGRIGKIQSNQNLKTL